MFSSVEKNHNELMKTCNQSIRNLIENDQYLQDFSCGLPSLEDILDKIGLHTGKNILIEVYRGDANNSFKIAIKKDSGTLLDLKKSIQREYENQTNFHKSISKESAIKNFTLNKKISWKYIWRTYALQFNEIQLVDNSGLLVADYGLYDNAIIQFVKIRKKKRKINF